MPAHLKFLLILFMTILCLRPLFSSGQFRQVHPGTDTNYALKLSFYTPAEGYVAFSHYIGFTTDSGHTFVQKTITASNVDYNGYSVNLTFGFDIQGVKAFNRDTLIVYGDYGLIPAILYSSNQGVNFKLVFQTPYNPADPNSSVADMVFPQNDLNGYAVDLDRVLKTTNGGLTWTVSYTSPANGFTALAAIDDNHVAAYGATHNLYTTADGGNTWQLISKPSGPLSGAIFFTPTEGWLCNNDGRVYETTNGGTTWLQQNTADLTHAYYTKMRFVNDSTGYALSNSFDVYKTSNSGKLWERLPRNNNYTYLNYFLYDLQFLNTQAWACGGPGYIELSTNDGGTTIPAALFAIDTAGVSVSGKVNLVNTSKSGDQYRWTVNGKLLGTTYNESYAHDIYHTQDTVQLIVSNQVYADTLAQYVTFNPPVIVKSFIPDTAITGTTVTITGLNLENTTAVIFGDTYATSFTQLSSTSVSAVVGPGASGKVTVVTPYGAGSKSGFIYIPPPAITAYSPLTAKAGNLITLHGIHFSGTGAVTFGGEAASSFTVVSDTVLTAVIGGGASGDIVVTTRGGTAVTTGFEMIPVINSFTPQSGTNGTVVHISGTGLNHVSAATIGNIAVRSFTVDSATSVTAIVSTGASGSIAVITPGGTNSLPGFTYYPPPVITAFSPMSGPVGTTVTISGSNFSAVPADNMVYFGAVQATLLSCSSTSLSVTVPTGATYQSITVITHHLSAGSSLPFTVSFAGGGSITSKTFSLPKVLAAAGGNQLAIDLDGDGKPDIISDDPNADDFIVLRNTSTPGDTSFSRSVLPVFQENGTFYVADLDGDGLPDIVDQNAQDGIHFSRNMSVPGNIRFGGDTTIIGSIADEPFYVADIDGDGKPDVIVGSSVYLNKSEPGHLNFYGPVNIPGPLLVADLNGDGKPDMIADNAAGQLYAFRNTSTPGKVSFTADAAVAEDVRALFASGDLDGDGKPDLVAIDGDGANKMYVFKNTSTTAKISFIAAGAYQTGNAVSAVNISDLDGDGRPDVAMICSADHKISLYKNLSQGGNIAFGYPVDVLTAPNVSGLVSCDLDGDGRTDLTYCIGDTVLVTLFNRANSSPFMTGFTPTHGITGTAVQISGLGLGNITAVSFGGVPAASFIINADTSITAYPGSGASGNVTVSNNLGSSFLPGFSFGQPVTISSFSPSSGIAGSQVTISGSHFDPVAANNTVYFGLAITPVISATAGQLVVNVPPAATYAPISVAADQTIAYSDQPFNLTFPGGDSTFNAQSFSSKFVMAGYSAIVGDLDGDGHLDIIFTSAFAGDYILAARNLGLADSVAFAPIQNVAPNSNVQYLYLADVNADGKPDLVCLNGFPGTVTIYRNTSTIGNISFAPPVTLTDPVTGLPFTEMYNLAINDIDGNGLPDIVADNYGSHTAMVYINQSSGDSISFRHLADYVVPGYATAAALRDLDADGKPEMIISSIYDNTDTYLSVFKNNSQPGNAAFGPRLDFANDAWPNVISVGDIDGDGKPDVIVANVTAGGDASVFHNTTVAGGPITFTKTTINKNIMSDDAVISDLNGDGKPDYLLDTEEPNELYLYHNSGSPGKIGISDNDDFVLPGLGGGIVAGDMDQDGKPDIIQSGNNVITILRNTTKKQLNLPVKNFKVAFTGCSCNGSNNGNIAITAATPLPYTATVTNTGLTVIKAFTDTTTVNGLAPGAYNVCLTVDGYPDFEQCFNATITDPAKLSVFTTVNAANNTVELQLSGAANYTVTLNGAIYQTSRQTLTLPLRSGSNDLNVGTAQSCQGTYTRQINTVGAGSVYPNPFTGVINVAMEDNAVPLIHISVVNLFGKEVYSSDTANYDGKLSADLSALTTGVYILKLSSGNDQTVYRIWKK